MQTTQQMTTLPNELAEAEKAKVARDRSVERWLREQGAPAYDSLKADPSRAVTPQRVRARVAAEHQKARARK